jgi:hypothetical protein
MVSVNLSSQVTSCSWLPESSTTSGTFPRLSRCGACFTGLPAARFRHKGQGRKRNQFVSCRLVGHLDARKATVPALHSARDAILAQSPACRSAPGASPSPRRFNPTEVVLNLD